MKDYKLKLKNLRASHTLGKGTGTPKDRDEVNRREVCECDGWVCDAEVIGAPPSRLRLICNAAALARIDETRDLSMEEKAARRKRNMPRCVCESWTPEAVKKRSVSRWACKNKILINSLWSLPDGSPIISKSHTHPSHSQTSRLLTSSLSLGVPVPRSTQCMWGV